MSLNYLATRFQCTWPWEMLVMLCDGRIVCGCADPYAKRVLGDAKRSSIEQIWKGSTLARIDLFNYGEAFLHKRAVEMCELIKRKYPHVYLYTSTNGTALSEEQARRLVHSGIDEVTFSIDGARPETYVQYRQRGKFEVAMRNLRAMADEKRKSARDLPQI